MVRYRNCAVTACEDEHSHRHRFPNPTKYQELFQRWVRACCNPRLDELDAEHIYKSYRVCHVHFTRDDISSNMYLKKGLVIPTQKLPKNLGSPVIEEIFHNNTTAQDNNDVVNITAQITEQGKSAAEPEPATLSSPTLDRSLPSTSRTTYIRRDREEVSEDECSPVFKKRRMEPVLKDIGVGRSEQLSPKARRLYSRVKLLEKSNRQLKRRTLFKKKKWNPLEKFEETLSNLSPTVRNFILTQMRLARKRPTGRRFNLNDKIFGLVLQKHSGKAYRTLSKLFALPSRKTLTTLLSRIPIDCGINEVIFDNLKFNVQKLSERGRNCIVLFDEVSLEPHIDVNQKTKDFEGFVHTGLHRTNTIADHALVFMVKGISENWKQPLMFTFCKGATNASSIMAHLTRIIKECQRAGLKVMASVSDQGQPNVSAINKLADGSEGRYSGFLKEYVVNSQRIIHIYDPPHLIKGIRNNLLTKDLVWEKEDGTLRAKWQNVKEAYEKDNSSGDLRSMPKLTDNHIYSDKLKKMKVSYATQVFSHSVAAFMNLLSAMPSAEDTTSPQSFLHTAKILKFFDQLFDSVNAHVLKSRTGKSFKCGASLTSGHIDYWRDARKSLSQMYFEHKGKKEVPPSLKNWMTTLAGFEELVKLLPKQKINFLLTRRVNQDPLENFFCQIRQHAGRNTNPTPTQFKHFFKTLLLNNFSSAHSVSSNCEMNDEDTNIISSVRTFVTQGVPEEDEFDHSINFDKLNIPKEVTYEYMTKISLGYVGGFILKKLDFQRCASCKNFIIAKTGSKEWHDLTVAKEYGGKVPNRLKYCTPQFLKLLCQCHTIIMYVLPRVCEIPNCIYQLMNYLEDTIMFTPPCKHNIKRQIIQKFVFLCSYNWSKALNKYLCGSESRKIRPQDIIQTQAFNYYKKRRKHKS